MGGDGADSDGYMQKRSRVRACPIGESRELIVRLRFLGNCGREATRDSRSKSKKRSEKTNEVSRVETRPSRWWTTEFVFPLSTLPSAEITITFVRKNEVELDAF